MKNLFLLAAFITVTLTAGAQNLAVFGGINLSNYKYKLNGTKLDRNNVFGFHLGLMSDVKLGGSKDLSFGVQPSLIYTGKGAENTNVGISNLKSVNRLNYVQLTLPVSYFFGDIKGSKDDAVIYGGVGPYVAYAISGKQKLEDLDGNITKTKFDMGNNAGDDFRSTDMGLSITGGAKIIGLVFHVQYDLGLKNINPEAYNGTIKNRNLMLSIGYTIK